VTPRRPTAVPSRAPACVGRDAGASAGARASARGRGLATAMCEHSQAIARSLGYKAMQFNFVASSNEAAIKLWNKLGFASVGRLPKAFNHPARGYVDALVLYKWLET